MRIFTTATSHICLTVLTVSRFCFLRVVHRNQRFEAEQAELQQKLATLQKELTVFKQQCDSLQEQVDQQHRLIQQLSESPNPQDPTEVSYHHPMSTDMDGECGPW